MNDEKNSKLGSRSENKGRKRKANRIYNILLTVVIVAIIAVAIPIFSGKDDNQSDLADDKTSENKDTVNDNTSVKEENSDDAENNQSEGDEDEKANAPENKPDEENETEGNTIVENSDDSNVLETYENDSWEPVGTTQTGEHVTDYTKGSVDWEEMEKAVAYGTGLSVDNMTVWYIGNGGAANKAIGTVSSKNDRATTYRVYIEWVDGQGWKPVRVELLKQNDKVN